MSHSSPHEADEARVSGRSAAAFPVPRLPKVILLATLASYTGINIINLIGQKPSPLVIALSCTTILLVGALQWYHSGRRAPLTPWWVRALSLSVQALVTYLPLLFFGVLWGSMAGFLAGSMLLLVPGRWGWALYGVVGLSMTIPVAAEGLPVVEVFYICQSTLLAGLVLYGVSRLSSLVDEVHAARAETARAAVMLERLRLSRDLHDLLGFSLSAVVLKAELIHRLIPLHSERASHEVEEVLSISRQALSDVRRVARGYREMSLKAESSSARSVLAAAGIDVTLDLAPEAEQVSQETDTVLATVLRESITNLLRHSKASRCTVRASVEGGDGGTVRLVVRNDGVVRDYLDRSGDSGSGIGNLRRRLDAIGGRLVVDEPRGEDGEREFRITASAPRWPAGTRREEDGAKSSAVFPPRQFDPQLP
ncbi:sensor histidine kinase [Streptomyces sp. NPDC056190]|uniref:sensor histidine kinase n=1 Tax=Streptomyces sp. NPDC056190 TaxID=3345741 RepID=UPI0035E003DF